MKIVQFSNGLYGVKKHFGLFGWYFQDLYCYEHSWNKYDPHFELYCMSTKQSIIDYLIFEYGTKLRYKGLKFKNISKKERKEIWEQVEKISKSSRYKKWMET